VEARRTRAQGRITRLEQLRARRAARRDALGAVSMDVATGQASGKIVAELTEVSKSYGDKAVVRDFSATILRGDKVGLVGPNGAGKTTLLKLILGELAPDRGPGAPGRQPPGGVLRPDAHRAKPDATLEDFISPGSEWIEIGRQRKHVKSYLGDFLFSPARFRFAGALPLGGERNRLLLARLFARPANVLVLDEPTNDLDIDTLELLEELLQDYEGTVFLVSHDRAFLDNVVTSTIAFEGDGRWREYEGGVEDWLTQSRRSREIAEAASAPASTASREKPAAPAAPAECRRRSRADGPAQTGLQGTARTRGPAGAHRCAGAGTEGDPGGALRRRGVPRGPRACRAARRAQRADRRRTDGRPWSAGKPWVSCSLPPSSTGGSC
jgi:ATP-binding cassette subfamily F protein uup